MELARRPSARMSTLSDSQLVFVAFRVDVRGDVLPSKVHSEKRNDR